MFTVDPMLRWRRRLSGAALAVAALVLFSPQVAHADPGVPVPPNGLLTDRGKGDVADADRDFVIKVRLAGLWEMPAGKMAVQKSDDPRIQDIGREIAKQHSVLDKLDRDAAKKLKIKLPDEPNADQQTWLAEMRAAEGDEFNRVYIDRLRAAHGKIFPAIATIRASTRNDTVRKLAQRANQFVMTHMTLLESSGIVDFAALPTAPPPSAAPSGAAGGSKVELAANSKNSLAVGGASMITIILVALASAAVTGFVLWRFMQRNRRSSYRRRQNAYY